MPSIAKFVRIDRAPVANFTVAPACQTCKSTMQFTDTSTNSPTSWSWNFGDGGTSTSQNPQHYFAASGTYTVTLTAGNTAGSNSTSKSVIISLPTPTPTITPTQTAANAPTNTATSTRTNTPTPTPTITPTQASTNTPTNTATAPTTSGFSPTSGPAGINVKITGSNFGGATSVTFNGTTASFTVNSSIQITATVPSDATTGKITVTTPAGTASSSSSFNPLPKIAGFSPTSGAVGTSVVLTGSNFLGTTAVTFNGASASFTVNSATQIAAIVPVDATTGRINVTTPAGSANTGSDFKPLPTITSFSPTSGPAGITVTISGANFTGATSVKFNGTNATFTVSSSVQISAVVPAGVTTGSIKVQTPAGTATSPGNFTVIGAPTITGFNPTSGPVGASVVITGTDLSGARSVTFGGTSATAFTVNSSTQITAAVPSGATTGLIAVTTPVGTATSASSFTVIVSPAITSFSPTSGVAGTNVVITGSGFTGTTAATFNGANAGFAVNSATQITATVPVNATTGSISVTTPAGSATTSSSFNPLPKIAGFSPTSGPAGTNVVLTGSNFLGTTAVAFDVANASFTVNSATQITATVPVDATTGKLTVTTSAGSATSTDFHPLPMITSFSPTSGPSGITVTISGANFLETSSVKFNGKGAAFTVNSSVQISAVVPSGVTTGNIKVQTPAGTATSSGTFTAAPVITSFSPTSGRIGTSVTINGVNFTGATAISFNGTAATFVVNSSTKITATVPVGAATGPIAVTAPGGTAASPSNFTVSP